MTKSKTGKYRIYSGVTFAAIFAIVGSSTSCGSSSITGGEIPAYQPPAQPPLSTIAATVADIVATPYLAGSTIRYLSDCQAGNPIQPAAGCVQGDDTLYDGTSPTISGSHGPWQTTTKGVSWLGSRTSGTNTLALAQGGVWNAQAATPAINLTGNTYCPAGQTCSEIREYPQGGTGPKPVIYGPNLGTYSLFSLGSGQRIMNLSLVGSTDGATTNQTGFFIYANTAFYPARHDDSILNVDITGFDLAISEQTPQDYNMTIQGSHFYANSKEGYLGSSQNLNLNYNSFIDTGGVLFGAASSHSIYVAAHEYVTGVNIIGNYVAGYFKGKGDTRCSAGQVALHAAITNLVVSGNAVIEDNNAADTCWGLSANSITGAAFGGFLRSGLFSDNIIVNGGNIGLNVGNCPYCVIENNLIIADNASAQTGISVPPNAARTSISGCTPSSTVQCYDDPSTNYTIRNNTVYFTANANNGLIGIQVGVGGSHELQVGHKVYNNSVTYLAATAGGNSSFNQVYCFKYPLPTSAYTTVDNNNCYVPNSSGLNYAWEQMTHDSLSAWKAANSFDANSSISNPGFALSAAPYFSGRTDSSLMYQLFNNGTTNVFSPASALSGKGRSGPSIDISGAARSRTAPSIGAYE